MRRSSRTVAFLACLGLAVMICTAGGRAGSAQQTAPQADQQPPTFRTGINFVSVDAIVTDKSGKPVGDLKPEDFEVTEQNTPQKVETFKLVSLDGNAPAVDGGPARAIRTDLDEEEEAARPDVRLFAMFLDDYHVRKESSLVMRNQVAKFVDTELGPSDMIGLMYPLESISDLRMTRDHDAVSRGIQQFEGRKYDYRPRNTVEEGYQHYPTETIEQIRNQVSLSAIEGLIIHMGSLKEGRKALILVSEGFTNLLPPQMRNPTGNFPGIENPNAYSPQAGVNDPVENQAAAIATWDMNADLRELTTIANRYNVSIYAVDPRGLATSEFGVEQNVGAQTDRQYLESTMDTLRTLAVQTDGRAIVNSNDLAAGMRSIVRDTSAYYLLGYTSTFVVPDGKFHEIKVRVKRPGVQVRARSGYWALNREEAARATAPPKPALAKPIENALTAAAALQRSRVIRSWIGTGRGESGKTKITFVWEPMPKVPGAPARDGDQPAHVTLMAAGSDGNPYFRGRVPDAGRRVTFDAPPGTMELRVSVESGASDVLDSETREIAVPDLTAARTVLSTPEIYRARTVREMQQIKSDPQPVPTIGREFARADRLLVRAAAYGPGMPKVSAKLLSQAGQAITQFTMTPSETATGLAEIELPLSSFAPGEYVLELDATGSGGDAQELVGFHIGG